MTSAASLRPESGENRGKLRTGLTTGVCATAAAVAAARQLLLGQSTDVASIRLPGGSYRQLSIVDLKLDHGAAVAGVIKDAGDDPDATHGARLWVEVILRAESGVQFIAGAGVGTVTRKGLVIPVGEPAINPVPRQMISDHLQQLADEADYRGGFRVTVGIDNGERIALRTMNGRLGIVGGLSVLGTTGIVRPFSCYAYIASIHQSIDVARANAIDHIAACTGGTSEIYAQQRYGLCDAAIVEMGDLFGAVLKYLRRNPVGFLSLCAGFGKIGKFAQGNLDTHSRRCDIDFAWLTQQVADLGGDLSLQEAVRNSNTSIEALGYCQQQDIPLGNHIAEKALVVARSYLPANIGLDVCAVDRAGKLVGYAHE